jgi:hypothetical protein
LTDHETFAPTHGPISCTSCFPHGFVPSGSLVADGWRIDNNPGYWGSSEPEVLVLGFSKGANQSRSMPFDQVAFNNARSNLREILTALRIVGPADDIDACFTSAGTKLGFASIIRCGLGMEIEPGKYATSGDVVRTAVSPGSPVRKFFDNCTRRFLGALPKSVITVVFLGLDRPYVEAVYERMKELHPSIRRLSELAYSTEMTTFVHVVHPSPLATSHRQNWLRDDASKLSSSRQEVAAALGLPVEYETGPAVEAPASTAKAVKPKSTSPRESRPTSDGERFESLVEALTESIADGRLDAEVVENMRNGDEPVKKVFRLRRADGEEFAVGRVSGCFQVWSSVPPSAGLRFAEVPEEYPPSRTRHSNLKCMERLRGPHGSRPGVRAWKLHFETLAAARDFISGGH